MRCAIRRRQVAEGRYPRKTKVIHYLAPPQVPYRRLVESKLHTAGELYEFMMDQFHEGRAFVMELVIIVILIIDLVFIFRGKG